MKIKAILFDLDGTLSHSITLYDIALREIHKYLRNNGYYKKSFSDFEGLYGKFRQEVNLTHGIIPLKNHRYLRRKKMMEELGEENASGIAYDMYKLFRDTVIKNIVVRLGTIKLLEELKSKGLKLGIVSNGEIFIRIRKLRKLGILDYFDCVVTGEEVGEEKPHQLIFLHAMNKLGVKASEVMMVGDNLITDIFGANEVGITTVFLDAEDNEKNINDLKISKPTYTIKKLSELSTLIKTKFTL